jgi:prolyl 4-hydroxylase
VVVPRVTLNQAFDLMRAGRKPEAALILTELAAAGDPGAVFTVGYLRFMGDMFPQDAVAGRALFERASEAGHAQGAIFYTNLLAAGIAGPRDWPEALRRLRREARQDAARRRALSLLEKMKLTADGDPRGPLRGETISETPSVAIFPRLFSADECGYLADIAAPSFEPSLVVDPVTGRDYPDPIRTSDGSTLHWLIEDPLVHALNRRIAAAAGSAVEQGESLHILRYRPGQQYRSHMDAIPGKENQRIATALVYLNDGYAGGETRFPKGGFQVKGNKGDAVVFGNVLPDGRPDPMSEHAGLPVLSGEKLLASRWICERPLR